MKPNLYYTALKTYDSDNKTGFSWDEYLTYSEIAHLTELVSLDGILNGLAFIPDLDSSQAWNNIVTEEGMVMFYFNTLEYVLEKVKDLEFFNLLAVIKEPNNEKADLKNNYDFIGYDLVEIGGDVSALTNCGGFDETFIPSELNTYGLISEYDKAKRIQIELPINNPEEQHVKCYLYEVWRHKTIGRKTN